MGHIGRRNGPYWTTRCNVLIINRQGIEFITYGIEFIIYDVSFIIKAPQARTPLLWRGRGRLPLLAFPPFGRAEVGT